MYKRLIVLIFLLLPGWSSGQVHITHYPAGSPMAYGTVNDLAFTKDGYLWLGGQTSLRRYDGTEMEYFGHRREHPHSMSNDFVHTLYEAPDGTLWIGHNRGFSRFDPTFEHFLNYRPPVPPGKQLAVYAFHADERGVLWLATDSGLRSFDPEKEIFLTDSAFLRRQELLGTGRVNTFLQEAPDRVLLGTANGLFRFHPANRVLSPVAGVDGNSAHAARATNHDLVIGGGTTLSRYRPEGERMRLVSELVLPHPEEHRFGINDIAGVGDDVFYLATTNGLYHVDWHDQNEPTIVNSVHDPEDEGSLVSNSVLSLTQSPDGVLLIGTRQGVDRISIRPSPIKVIRRVPGKVDLCDDLTKGSAVDSVHNLLVLGTQSGLSLVDLNGGEVRCYTPENLPGMRRARLFNVDPGPRPHTFWLGYRQGGTNLLVLDEPDNPRIEDVSFGPNDLSAAGVYQVVPDAGGVHWLATSNGLFAYDPVTDKTTGYQPEPQDSTSLSSGNLFSVLNDSQGRLWVGTRDGGLCLKQSLDGREGFKCFRYEEDDPTSLPSDMVLHVFEDQEGRIWISNPEALALYLEDGTFRTFGLDDGLPYTLCYGAFADARGRIWVAFGGHFCQIELGADGKFHLRRTVTMRDGLAGQANAQYGWSLLPDGSLALSQRTGLNIFHPDSLRSHDEHPGIILTDLELFDHSASPNQERDTAIATSYVLPDDINRLDHIDLPPGQDFISLRFSASEYRPGYETWFGYRMVGIQDDWTNLEDRTFLSFPKLPPGDYTLELRTGNAGGDWSDQIRTLSIHLAAPWFRRWWALLSFGLAGAAIIYWLASLTERQRQRVAAARTEEREEIRRRSARDFHDEAGNHLSRVSLLTMLAERQLAEGEEARTQVKRMLGEIASNTQVLREGMRDFIWALDPDNDRASELALRLKRFGQELFAHHPAEFRAGPFAASLDALSLRAGERRHLTLIFKEAMHNSLKHAPDANSFTLTIDRDNNLLVVIWTDDGPGCDESGGQTGMGLKSMRARAEKIGAAISIGGAPGCTVSVRLPLAPNG